MACGIFCTFPIISVLAPISYPSHLHSDNKCKVLMSRDNGEPIDEEIRELD